MRKHRKMQDEAISQLARYHQTKALIEAREELSAYVRAPVLGIRRGNLAADPTGNQAVNHLEDPELERLRGWIWAIESTWEFYKDVMPEKAELMVMLFGLGYKDVRLMPRYSREDIVCRLHVSEPTVYRWREDIVTMVVTGAIQAGVIKPFGEHLHSKLNG